MVSFRTVSRTVMGLPKPSGASGAEPPAAGGPAAPRQGTPPNPWESAGAELRQRAAALPDSAAPSGDNGQQPPAPSPEPLTPWAPHEERSGTVFARRLGRGLVWFVLLLAAVTGVRSWILPPQAAPETTREQTTPSYPEAEAQALATRFARAYLTWDEEAPEERERELVALLPPGADPALGWDGKGGQEVRDAQPGAVTREDGKRARVRVEVLVRVTGGTGKAGDDKKTGADEEAESTSATGHWIGLDVPVTATDAGVVVSGTPGLVGLPERGAPAPDVSAPAVDDALSARTRPAVEEFFRAYAAGDPGSVTAPGSTVPALPRGITLQALTSWQADTGSGDERSGTATVTWTLGDAEVEQSYRVRIVRVSTANAHRWQVTAVHGGAAGLPGTT